MTAGWEDAADRGKPAERPRWHLRPDLTPPPEGFKIIIDTREQTPFFEGRRWARRGSLRTGDYSLEGFESRVVLERKSLSDAYGTFGRGRERFERELDRLTGFERKALLIEGDYADVLDPGRLEPHWRSSVRPASVEGSMLAWSHRYGVEVLFGGPRRYAERLAFRWLATWWLQAQPADDWEKQL